MKKLLALTLALVMLLAFAGCGDKGSKGDIGNLVNGSADENDPVAEYVEAHQSELKSGFASAFGSNVKVEVYSEDSGIIVKISMAQLDSFTDDQIEELQDYYDSLESSFETILEGVQKELPECEFIRYDVCDSDGNVLAVVDID